VSKPAAVIESPTALSAPAETVPEPTPATPPAPAVAAAPAAAAAVTAARFDAAYLHNPRPAYPMLSRRLREEGQVMLRVLVSADGQPARVELRTSSGSDRLDRAAQEAVARWRFVPARRGDVAVEAWVLVPIVFKLQGN
jgi:protein TonB